MQELCEVTHNTDIKTLNGASHLVREEFFICSSVEIEDTGRLGDRSNLVDRLNHGVTRSIRFNIRLYDIAS